MIFKIILIALCVWITVYSGSYACFEKALGNRWGMCAVLALCFINSVFVLVAVLN